MVGSMALKVGRLQASGGVQSQYTRSGQEFYFRERSEQAQASRLRLGHFPRRCLWCGPEWKLLQERMAMLLSSRCVFSDADGGFRFGAAQLVKGAKGDHENCMAYTAT